MYKLQYRASTMFYVQITISCIYHVLCTNYNIVRSCSNHCDSLPDSTKEADTICQHI